MAPESESTPHDEPTSTEGSGVASSILDRARKAKEQVAAKVGELKDSSLTKMAETIDDFNGALPVIREAGYTLSSVDIGIGLPPKVSASFVASNEVSAENVERLIAANAEKKFTLLLMKSLYQAWQLQQKINIVGLKPKGLSVEIGLIPVVSIRFA